MQQRIVAEAFPFSSLFYAHDCALCLQHAAATLLRAYAPGSLTTSNPCPHTTAHQFKVSLHQEDPTSHLSNENLCHRRAPFQLPRLVPGCLRAHNGRYVLLSVEAGARLVEGKGITDSPDSDRVFYPALYKVTLSNACTAPLIPSPRASGDEKRHILLHLMFWFRCLPVCLIASKICSTRFSPLLAYQTKRDSIL